MMPYRECKLTFPLLLTNKPDFKNYKRTTAMDRPLFLLFSQKYL